MGLMEEKKSQNKASELADKTISKKEKRKEKFFK